MQVRDSRKFVGVAHSISASGVVTDCKSCALTLFYTPEMLTGLEGGRFSIYYYNEQAGRWEDQGGVVDRENRSVSAPAKRFGTYAIVADDYRTYLPIIIK